MAHEKLIRKIGIKFVTEQFKFSRVTGPLMSINIVVTFI